jgi:hypothetical protein
MTECNEQKLLFQELGDRKVELDFSGGYLTSDGGAILLRQLESQEGIIGQLADCFIDTRRAEYVEHSVEELLRQRIFGLVMGYEDLNDHDRLRLDPMHALLAGKKDPLGLDRHLERDKGKALAAHSTLNRLELGAQALDERYKKIQAQPEKIEALLIQRAVKALPRKSREIVLDFDATDDPLHGKQEGAYFHGYYKNYCYLPLYCFCGNIPFLARLRDCKRDASEGTVEALQKIVRAIRKRFGKKVAIIVRADSGFAREELMEWCENNKVYYCIGMARNKRLVSLLEEKLFWVRARAILCGGKATAFAEFEYQTLKSWSRKRRLIGKAERLNDKDNPRFIVTNLPKEGFKGGPEDRFSAQSCYQDFYCARGDMENRIKEQQLELFSDRTSTHFMASNQLRLWFSAFAHLILSRLKATVLLGTVLQNATVGQIRLRLFKIAASLRVSVRRIHIQLCSAYPLQELFKLIHQRLCLQWPIQGPG